MTNAHSQITNKQCSYSIVLSFDYVMPVTYRLLALHMENDTVHEASLESICLLRLLEAWCKKYRQFPFLFFQHTKPLMFYCKLIPCSVSKKKWYSKKLKNKGKHVLCVLWYAIFDLLGWGNVKQ